MRKAVQSMFLGLFPIAFLVAAPLATESGALASPKEPVNAKKAHPQKLEDAMWGNGQTIRGKGITGFIAFTFDDGPHLKTTPIILDILAEYNVPATFFVVGRHFVGQKPVNQQGARLLLEMVERGFTIGNHTTNHKNLTVVPTNAGKRHVADNATYLKRILGYQPRLFRAPFGATTPAIRKFLRRRGDTLVSWNIDPQDFRKRPGLREKVVRQILAKSGGIIVLHDTKQTTADALPGILQDLQDANCTRISSGKAPIFPVSLQFFMRPRGKRVHQTWLSDMSSIHSYRHRLWKHCKQLDLSN